jgi:hypothetical protein
MTVLETVLVFAGAPLAVFAVVALLVYGLGARRTPRYRPGRSFEFQPVWFLASAPRSGDSVVSAAELTGAGRSNSGRPAITAADSGESAEERRAAAAARRSARRRAGGSEEDSGGESERATSAVATRDRTARKGGARGTW